MRPYRSHAFFLLALPLLAPRALAQRNSPFMEECRKLMAVHAEDEIGPLMRKHEQEAILAVIEICEAIGQGSSDVFEEEIDVLGKAWKKTYNTKFVEIEYNYFSLGLTGPYKRQRHELLDHFNGRRKDFDAAVQAKDTGRLPALGQEFNTMGDQFAELGDHYMAALSYLTYAMCFDDVLNGSKADYRLAHEGWGLFLQARERIELRDKAYNEGKARVAKLELDGFGGPEKAPDAPVEPKPAADGAGAGAATPLHAVFELVPDIEAIQRPMYTADSNFQIWSSLGLAKIDSKATIPTMETSPNIVRTGANKAAVDVDGDGKGDVDIPLTGKIMPVQITLGADKRPWGFLAAIGQQRDTYQGFTFNLAPDENQMAIYVAGAGSLVGTLNTVRVQVIDDNMDGLYGSAPKDWAYVGLREGALQHDVDTVVVGDSKVARPWSALQRIGDAWFTLEPDEKGTDIIATRTEVQSGTLQLDLKGVVASWVLVRGSPEKERVYDLVNGGTNKVEVPVGSYELYAGQVASGKKSQMMKALILPSNSTRSWKVGSGETVKVELGAPFGFEFNYTQDDATVTVDGPSIVVVGRGAETYQRLWNCVLMPEVLVRKAGSSKGKKEAKLVPVTSQEGLQDHKNDYRSCWFPVGEPFQKPSQGEAVEIQLLEKKHKLFGKIESPWKGN